MEIYLYSEGIEYGDQRGELRVTFATFYGDKGVDAHASQVSQRLLVNTQMLSALLDIIANLLLVHINNIL